MYRVERNLIFIKYIIIKSRNLENYKYEFQVTYVSTLHKYNQVERYSSFSMHETFPICCIRQCDHIWNEKLLRAVRIFYLLMP